MKRTAAEMVGYARSRTLGNISRYFRPVRATHHRARTSVLHPPYVNNPGSRPSQAQGRATLGREL